MNIVYIIIAVIILAAIAIFFLRGSKNKTPSQPTPTATPKPIAQAQSEPVPAPVPEKDYVLNAQDFINQQRYDDAITELKTGLKKKPKNSAILLKLLNVYALTNRRDEFDGVFNDIQATDDTNTIQQAQNLKTMLDEEADLKNAPTVASPVVAVTAAPKDEPISLDNESLDNDMSLDFAALEDTNLTMDAPVADTGSEMTADTANSLSFDDLETQLLDADSSGDTSTVTPSDDGVFDFSADLEGDDLSFDEPSAAAPSVEESKDEFDFSFDDVAPEVAEVQPPTQELDFADVDASIEENVLTFDEIEASAATETQQVELVAPEANELQFDEASIDEAGVDAFNIEDGSAENSIVETASTANDTNVAGIENDVENTEATEEIALEWDEPQAETMIDIVPAPLEETAADSDTLAAVEAPVAPTDYEDTFAQLDALSDTSLLGAATSETPQVDDVEAIDVEPTIAETDAAVDTSEDTVLPTEDVTAPVIDDSEFMQSFGFLQDLDNSQITLDLAQQYLELGEYDSAKRLVTEVMDGDSSDAQKTLAQDILARMN